MSSVCTHPLSGKYIIFCVPACPKTIRKKWHAYTVVNLILKKTGKIAATRCHILRLKCTKIDFGWGSAPDPAGELTALPRPLAGFEGAYV